IVQIYELGRVGTEYFISMEYIDGRDVRRILRHARRVTGPPPIHVTVGLLLQLCEALDYAHTRTDDQGRPLGLVHRDVSPSNLLITKAGHLKVIDFGIAKAQSSQLRTQTGRVKGKLAYMAPEALAGKDFDARSDLFAAGVIAHELLTARPLFASKNEYQTLLKVQRGDIMPPSTFNQACPAELDAIVLRALARDPHERFGSAAALRDELQALRRRHDLQTGHRDVAQWIDWAFSIEPPSGNFAANTFDQTGPHQRGDADADAIELAWGGGEAPHEDGPVVLEDVPDVSEKHLAPRDPDDDDDDLDDDIPPAQPSHGPLPRARRAITAELMRGGIAGNTLPGPPQRNTLPGPGLLVRRPSGKSQPPPPAAEPPAAEPPAPAMPVDPGVPPEALRTMSNLPPLASAARIRAVSVAPRDLPSLEPLLGASGAADGADPDADPDQLATTSKRRRRPAGAGISPGATIGTSIIARRSSRGGWVVLLVLLLAGAGAGAAAIYGSRHAGDGRAPEVVTPEPPRPVRTAGTVKFVTMPDDAEITVEGHPTHHGSPWALELAAGVHQITIQRSGYKAWLTSLELSANETQVLRVVLEPLGGAPASAEATLSLSTTPSGLEVVLDGQLLPQRTPLRLPIRPGRHVIVVRQDGAEVWRHELDARPSVDYEFTPSMTDDKRRERAEREASPRDRVADARPAITDVERDAAGAGRLEGSARTVERRIESPSLPPIAEIAPEPAAPPTPPPSPSPAAAKGPVIVPPTMVTRTGGATPTIHQAQRGEVPPVVAAKLCIDTAGRVTAVDVLTKLAPATKSDLAATLRGWMYRPYKQRGAAVPACFSVSFRVK
ncbi:MAG TPA: serine/threonine-protein kinase, partial [Kofleriaceae bacterium]|nr:serine/threonine-protein kinase [Kofleriaceae bacterium]